MASRPTARRSAIFQEAIMNDSVQITIDRDVNQRLQLLMAPRSAT